MLSDTGKLKRRSFLSQVVNNIVLNENNPRGDRPARVGEATVERASDESFFNLAHHVRIDQADRDRTGEQ